MGLFLNLGNENFAEFVETNYFVDKSKLINILLKKDITEKFICNSRARRFGKSVTADMLVAYFSKGADSRKLFEPLRCVKDALFYESMNAYDTIFVDIQAQFKEASDAAAEPNQYIRSRLVCELREAYPDLVSREMTLVAALSTIYDKSGSRFVIIFDEWDYPIRELGADDPYRKAYIEMLRGLFKSNAAKSSIEYNDENSLSCTIMIALISAFSYYHRPIREFPSGKGFADIVYLPRAGYPNCPVLVVELKWDKSVETAIAQMKKGSIQSH